MARKIARNGTTVGFQGSKTMYKASKAKTAHAKPTRNGGFGMGSKNNAGTRAFAKRQNNPMPATINNGNAY